MVDWEDSAAIHVSFNTESPPLDKLLAYLAYFTALLAESRAAAKFCSTVGRSILF